MSPSAESSDDSPASESPRPELAAASPARNHRAAWRRKLYEVIFEADTFPGKLFDIALLVLILISITAVSVETLEQITPRQKFWLDCIEWALTMLFTIEYLLRLICVDRPRRYATSFFGIVDLLSVMPTYLQIIVPGASSFAMVRSLRLLRIFRVFKVVHLLTEADVLYRAFWEARGKIVVFFGSVLVTVTIMGTLMYEVENRVADSTFTSIPEAMYWAVVTMTTVGYGDIVPQTPLGKFLSAILILMGYSLIIVPTGFVSAEIIQSKARYAATTRTCPNCLSEGHDYDARFCKYCGTVLHATSHAAGP